MKREVPSLSVSASAVLFAGFRRALRIATEHRAATVWTLLVGTCAMFVAALALVVGLDASRWTAASTSGASLVVYLGESVDSASSATLVDQLRALPGVDSADLIPPAESGRRLRQALGADTALLDGVELGSLPASVEVVLQPGVRDVVALSPTVNALRGAAGVEDIVLDEGGDEKAATAFATVRTVLGIGASLLGVLSLIILFGALRVRLDRGTKEPIVLRLLGASPTFLAIPTLLAGAFLAIGCALLAALALAGALWWKGEAIAQTLAPTLGRIDIAPLGGGALLLFVVGASLLGAIAGGLAGVARATR